MPESTFRVIWSLDIPFVDLVNCAKMSDKNEETLTPERESDHEMKKSGWYDCLRHVKLQLKRFAQ